MTDDIFLTAARTLATNVSEADLARGSLFLPLGRIRAISTSIASAVARVAYENGLATEPRPDDLQAFVEAQTYTTCYESYV